MCLQRRLIMKEMMIVIQNNKGCDNMACLTLAKSCAFGRDYPFGKLVHKYPNKTILEGCV